MSSLAATTPTTCTSLAVFCVYPINTTAREVQEDCFNKKNKYIIYINTLVVRFLVIFVFAVNP